MPAGAAPTCGWPQRSQGAASRLGLVMGLRPPHRARACHAPNLAPCAWWAPGARVQAGRDGASPGWAQEAAAAVAMQGMTVMGTQLRVELVRSACTASGKGRTKSAPFAAMHAHQLAQLQMVLPPPPPPSCCCCRWCASC